MAWVTCSGFMRGARFPSSDLRRTVNCCVTGKACQARSTAPRDIHMATLGNICIDILLEVQALPAYTGDHQGLRRGAKLSCGGAFNCLISGARLGATAAPVGFVDLPDVDSLTSFMLRSATSFGFVSEGMVPLRGYITPSCAVLVEQHGDHTFLSSNEKGNSNRGTLDPKHLCLTDSMFDVLRRSQNFVVDGYACAGDSDIVDSALSVLDSIGEGSLWVDPQALACSMPSSPTLRRALQFAHGLSLTLDEARGLTAAESLSTSDVLEALLQTVAPSARVILLKLGSSGCIVRHRPDPKQDVWSTQHVRGFELRADEQVDTTGCGDAFLGAFLAGSSALGLTLYDSCVLANAAGAATCKKMGTGKDGIASVREILRLLQSTDDGRKLLGQKAVRATFMSVP
jgi:sugar/nucleoside kinase (ribokinase family)